MRSAGADTGRTGRGSPPGPCRARSSTSPTCAFRSRNSSASRKPSDQRLEPVLHAHVVPGAGREAIGRHAVDVDRVGEVGPLGVATWSGRDAGHGAEVRVEDQRRQAAPAFYALARALGQEGQQRPGTGCGKPLRAFRPSISRAVLPVPTWGCRTAPRTSIQRSSSSQSPM